MLRLSGERAIVTIDCMVNSSAGVSRREIGLVTWLIAVYVGAAVATVGVLVALTVLAPAQATNEAWGHAVVVAVFAALLHVRWRAAKRGNARARTATGVIAAVLVVVNIVESAVPGFFPPWMRVEMLALAALMVAVALLILGRRR